MHLYTTVSPYAQIYAPGNPLDMDAAGEGVAYANFYNNNNQSISIHEREADKYCQPQEKHKSARCTSMHSMPVSKVKNFKPQSKSFILY